MTAEDEERAQRSDRRWFFCVLALTLLGVGVIVRDLWGRGPLPIHDVTCLRPHPAMRALEAVQ